MMNDTKESYIGHLSCKSHTARTEKDLYRICPSKLSKRELEDLYFALLEQNVQLKKTINDQREQIKVLNTKVQRMTAQKPVGGFHNKDCCAGSKAVINEQKESIADLKKANERLSERLRLLNMRLCSAKQFLRRGTSQASNCSKCLVPCASIKNSSMSALNTKRSDGKLEIDSSPCQIVKDNVNLQITDVAVPTQLADISIPTQLADISIPTQLADISIPTQLADISIPTQLADISIPTQLADISVPTQLADISIPTQTADNSIPTQMAEVTSSQAEIPVQDAPCKRDECRTEIDDLKLKIVALEEEVCHVRRSHSERMRALEVTHAQCGARALRHAGELRHSRQQTDELATQLQLQRARASEQRARRRDHDVTERLDRASSCLANRIIPMADPHISDPAETDRSTWESCPPIVIPDNSGISIFNEEKYHKNSIDSAYTDCKSDDVGQEKERNLQKRDEPIENQIANVPSPIAYIKVNTATEAEPTGATLGAESSLSHDIFSTSRFKTLKEFDKVPSTSREPEFLVSDDHIIDEATHRPEKTNKYGSEFKYHIPGPLSLEMPRMYLGDTGTDIKIVENEVTNKNSENYKSSEGSIKINKIKQKKQELVDGDKNTIIESLDKSNQIIQEIIEEGKANNAYKKNRRSSLKSHNEGKQNRDLAVRYGETQTYKSSAKSETNIKNVSQGTDTDKVYIEMENDHDSDPSVQYKVNERVSIRRIRYMNDVQTDPYMPSEQKSPDSDRADNVTERDGTERVENDVSIQCLRDLTPDGSCEETQSVSYVPTGPVNRETIANVDPNNLVLCAALCRVCECPLSPGPPRVSLRTCSGAPAPAPTQPGRYRACSCGHYPPPPLTPHENRHSLLEPRHSSPKARHSTPESPAISEKHHSCSTEPRLASSDYNDGEASSLTDLTRTHDTNPSDYPSPGEEKAAARLNESYATTDCSLSEGEVPAARGKRLSTTVDKTTEPVWGPRSDKMDDALRAISDELTRCRELLQGRGEEGASPIALRRADGTYRLRDSYTPKCIFTLHVGTVVLADKEYDDVCRRCLHASWRLYRQAASSTRPLQGRVFNYDCTMHYDLKVTEHFLYYLKHEEMPIVLTEIDKPGEVFATCSLPLRDALLHPNRRVDMSLALVPSGGGEEAGVLDVWCSLRVDAAMLPAINTAIFRSQHRSSSMLEQILDDDQTADYRLSEDLHRRRSKGASQDIQSCNSETLDKVPELRRSFNEMIENEVPSNIRTVNDFKHAVAKKSNDSTSIYEMLKNKKWNRRSTLGSQKAQEGGRQKSVTICNQSNMDKRNTSQTTLTPSAEGITQSLDITILWLALNEDCRAMSDPSVKRLYVAYSFLGKSGADLETPTSLPKPKHYMDKCHFLFKKTFVVSEGEMLPLGRLACFVPTAGAPDPTHAVVFSIVSEPADDPLGLYNCEDIGYAYLYLGEVLSRSAGASHTAVLEVKDVGGVGCGALAVRLEGLGLLRRCRERAATGPPHTDNVY